MPVLYSFFSRPAGVTDWKGIVLSDDIFSRFTYIQDNDTYKSGISPSEILEKSKSENFQSIVERHDENASMYLLDCLDNEFYSFVPKSETKNMMNLAEEMLIAGKNNTYIEFNKWLLSIEEENGGKELIDDRYMDWYKPEGQRQALILLPITKNYEILAFIHFFGAESFGSSKAIAMLRYWHEKYGAEIVGHYGTLLNIKVKSVPECIEEALGLAIQQEAFAECTTIPAGVNIRDHARLLMKKKQWLLHQRP
jgi:hypothetical protein